MSVPDHELEPDDPVPCGECGEDLNADGECEECGWSKYDDSSEPDLDLIDKEERHFGPY